jgi:oligopeptide transport system substrate-binding protein
MSAARHLFFVACLAASVLAGCTSNIPKADFTFINGVEPETLDPAILTGQPEGRLASALFEGLTARRADGRIGPGMAEHWDISKDGRTYLFHLRPDARWSNGDPLTAHDFVASWKRLFDPRTASPYAELLFPIEGAEDYQSGSLTDFSRVGVRALDERRLEVRLRMPTAYFLDLVAFPTSFPVHLASMERWGRDAMKPGKLVNNGAYLLRDWKINDGITLAANPLYWRADTVRFKTIRVLHLAQATTAFNFYATGIAHLILDKGLIPPTLLGELRQRPDFHTSPVLATYFYRFNVTRPPFNDPRVRRAIGMAIDKAFMVQRITRCGEPVTGSIVPKGLPDYTPPQGLPYDPAAARALLAEAGYPGGKGFPAFTLLYNKTEQDEHVATAFQSMMRQELGLSVELRNQEWRVYLNSLTQLDYDMARSSWVGDYADPNTFLDCFITGRGNNRCGYANPAYDQLVATANATLDPARRASLLAEAERLLVEHDAPVLPLFHFVGIKLYDATKLGGFHPNLLDEYPLRELFWK